MKTLILLFLMTSVCWGECDDKNIIPALYCIDGEVIRYDGCQWECVSVGSTGKLEFQIKTLQDHVDRLAVAYKKTDAEIKHLVELAKLQQEKYEQQQYQLDTLSQTVMERGKK